MNPDQIGHPAPHESLITDSVDSPAGILPNSSDNPQEVLDKPRPRVQLVYAGWALLGVLSFLFFTLLKIPTQRIESNITQQVTQAAFQAGFRLQPEKSRVKMGLGLSYEMQNIKISNTSNTLPTTPTQFDLIRVSPSLLSYAFGKVAGKFEVVQKEGSTLSGTFSMPDPTKGRPGNSLFKAEWNNLEPARWIPTSGDSPLAQLSGKVDGGLEFAGDIASPDSWVAQFLLTSNQLSLPESKVMGMTLPGLKVSALSVRAKIEANSKKLKLEEFNLGKLGANEDIAGTLSGTLDFPGDWRNPSLNLTAKYRIQGELQKRLGAMLMLIDKYKKEDGSYSMSIVGSPKAPQIQ
jgi:type II secretion system protein N